MGRPPERKRITVWVDHEELWEVWEVSTEEFDRPRWTYDGPLLIEPELLERFGKAKEEMEAVWEIFRALLREEV